MPVSPLCLRSTLALPASVSSLILLMLPVLVLALELRLLVLRAWLSGYIVLLNLVGRVWLLEWALRMLGFGLVVGVGKTVEASFKQIC
jgi:hypothetical protein